MLRRVEQEILRVFVALSFCILQKRKNQPPEDDWFSLFISLLTYPPRKLLDLSKGKDATDFSH